MLCYVKAYRHTLATRPYCWRPGGSLLQRVTSPMQTCKYSSFLRVMKRPHLYMGSKARQLALTSASVDSISVDSMQLRNPFVCGEPYHAFMCCFGCQVCVSYR